METHRDVTPYRIVVRGAVSELVSTIDGIRATDHETVLHAEVVDQAQLHGILASLRDFGVELVRVEPEPL